MNTSIDTLDKMLALADNLTSPDSSHRVIVIRNLINAYREELISNSEKTRFLNIVNMLTEINADNINFIFKLKTLNPSGRGDNDYEFIFNNTFKYVYRANDGLEELLNFIGYMSTVIPEMANINTDDMKPTTPRTVYITLDNNDINPQNTITEIVKEDSLQQPDDVADLNERDYEDEERLKLENVKTLKAIKDNADKRTAAHRAELFNKRVIDATNYLASLPDPTESIEFITTWLIDFSNNQTLDILEFTNYVIENCDIKLSKAMWRVVIESVANNLADKLIKIASFKPNRTALYMAITSQDKADLIILALALHGLINEHAQAVNLDIPSLAIRILDYCDKTSSTAVAESPEELTQLAIMLYGVVLSKNLTSEFIYAVDINSQHIIDEDDWFINNDVISHYLDVIRGEAIEDIKSKPIIDTIATIIDSRDKLMTDSTLSNSAAAGLYIQLDTLTAMYDNPDVVISATDRTIVIGGKYSEDNTVAFVIATESAICTIIRVSDMSYIQSFYNAANVMKLTKWLSYFITKHQGAKSYE